MNELAAYFLILDNKIGLESDDTNMYLNRAEKFHKAASDLSVRLSMLEANEIEPEAEEIQFHFYEVAKTHYSENIREFFRLYYLVMFETESATRPGTFIKLIGLDNFLNIFRKR